MTRPSAPNRDAFAHFETLPTRWADNDQYGHMNNVVHYALMDTAISDWQRARGLLDEKGTAHRQVVVESGCTYFDEAGYPDVIHIGLRVGHLGRTSWRYDCGLFRNEAPMAFAAGHFTQVLLEAERGRPCPLPDALRAALEELRVGESG